MAKGQSPAVALRKYGFWIALGAVTLLMFLFWLVATLGLAREFSAKKARIVGSISKLNTIESPTPNEKWVAKIGEETKKVQKLVFDVWTKAYERQKAILDWPRVERDNEGKVVRPGFSDDFIRAVAKLPPPERLGGEDPPPTSATQSWITNRQRFTQEYRNYGKEQIQEICDILKTMYRLDDKGAAPGDAPTTPDAAGAEDLAAPGEWVVWPRKLQERVRDYFLFAEGRNPTTQEILYAQEDLWVGKAIANVVRKTNEAAGTLGNYNAAVKRIHMVQVGERRDTAAAPREPYRLGGKGPEPKAPSLDPAEPAGDEKEGEAKELEIPIHLKRAGKRYVDAQGKPLSGKALLDLADKAEFKRIPVYMKLEVDQRHLSRLLVECVNSPLTIEIKQMFFTIEPAAAKASSASADAQVGGEAPKIDNKTAYDMTVDLHGVIYIYYPAAAPAPAGDEAQEEAGDQVAAKGAP